MENLRYFSFYNKSIVYAALGNNDAAIDALRKACDQHTFWMLFTKVDVKLDRLRSDPRFASVLACGSVPQ